MLKKIQDNYNLRGGFHHFARFVAFSQIVLSKQRNIHHSGRCNSMGSCPNCQKNQFLLKNVKCKVCDKIGCKSCFIFLFSILQEFGSPTAEEWWACSNECLEKIAQRIEEQYPDNEGDGKKPIIRSLVENYVFSPKNTQNLAIYTRNSLLQKVAMHVYFKNSDPSNIHGFFNDLKKGKNVIENPTNPLWERLNEKSEPIYEKNSGRTSPNVNHRHENKEMKQKEYSGMLIASNILANPSLIDALSQKYVVVFDQALAGLKFDNLNRAINVMAEKGWRCVSLTSFNAAGQIFSSAFYMYALMENHS
jgi:hypothetical protein